MGEGTARRRRALPLARAAGRRDPIRRSPAVPAVSVIRRRLEDTVKMAVVSGLARRPLEQVGGAECRPHDPARSLSSLRPPERPFFFSPRQVSGLLRRRFHRTAPAALQVTGLEIIRGGAGRAGPGPPVLGWRPGSRLRGGGWARAWEGAGSRILPGTSVASAPALRGAPACYPSGLVGIRWAI